MSASYSMSNDRYSIKDLARMLASDALNVARYLLPNGKREGHEYVVGDVSGVPGSSLSINVSKGTKAGLWKDFATQEGGDLVELWALARCGGDKGKAIPEIKRFLSLHDSYSRPAATVTPIQTTIPPAAVAKRQQEDTVISQKNFLATQSDLLKCEPAMAYLHGEKRGLEDATIVYFGLGLSNEYIDNKGVVRFKALMTPMRSPQTGELLSKRHYYNIPGVTVNPKNKNGWMGESPRTYWAQAKVGQSILFICEGLKDVWRHWQELHKDGLTDRVMLITSTHGTNIPKEWESPEFWAPWSAIYLGQDNDDTGRQFADNVRRLIRDKGVYRAEVPSVRGKDCKDWTDYWQMGGTIDDFRKLLDRAVVISPRPTGTDEPNLPLAGVTFQKPRVGNFTLTHVDINNNYVNGFLYYPTARLVVEPDPENPNGVISGSEQLVVRSDKTLHFCYMSKARSGLAPELFLSDGTLLLTKPVASQKHSWKYGAIDAYLNDKTQPRTLAEIVKEVLAVLKATIWLPYPEDYVALAMTVPATYVQSVFEGVPLLALVGPPASGKTEAGNMMADLCCNGDVIGQVSAAAAAREIDSTAGFVVFDDLEGIAGNSKKGEMSFSDLLQMLKVSNKKKAAVKIWHNMKTGKQERLNLFGIKLFNNTQGIDSILNTRVICILTRPVPEYLKEQYRDKSIDPDRLTSLRNELHAWAFDHVREVDSLYHSKHATRQDEIFEPLRVIAKMVGNPALTGMLEACAGRQQRNQVSNSVDDPNALLKEAAENLIQRGFKKFTIAHVQLEMRTLVDSNWGKRSTTEIPEWDDSRWLGKVLHTLDLIEPESNPPERQVIFGNNLRIKQFKAWFMEDVREKAEGQGLKIVAGKKPQDFCPGCPNCQYRNAGCTVMAGRREFEEKKARVQVQ